MFQLSVGGIAREYCVLSFNAMSPAVDREVSNIYQWKQAGPVCAHVREDVGKVATTWFSAIAHCRHTWEDLSTLKFSVIAIRIGTGRRHQIRTHITHIGHPTVLDAKYTDAVWEPEAFALQCRNRCKSDADIAGFPLHNRRFSTVYPAHVGLDPISLNPALLEMTAGCENLEAVLQKPVNNSATPSLDHSSATLAKSGSTWSRHGPCSKAPRRVDEEGRDKDRCMVCGEFGHWSRECPNGGKDRCLVCGKMGHRARDCPEGAEVCAFCRRIGHSQQECPQLYPGYDFRTPYCFDFRSDGICKFGKKCPFQHIKPRETMGSEMYRDDQKND